MQTETASGRNAVVTVDTDETMIERNLRKWKVEIKNAISNISDKM